MAAHSNRSPSPLCSRPINPNPRNSENNSTNRRSFSGKPSILTNPRRFDPITPANSPSDFARSRSVGEEKENDEKDLRASKLKSPAKGSKNFMSPTISAASKFTPSPRKKVLVERNDPVRTSISLSDGKAMFFSSMSSNVSEDFDSKSEAGNHQNPKAESFSVADSENKKVVSEGHPASKPSKRVSFSDVPSDSQRASESLSESVLTTDSDSLRLESVTTDADSLTDNVVLSSIAPLDADPSCPPYDPKTNFLSPRPQFLHYKPNPRIEILLSKEKGLDPEEFQKLEDSLMAEIMSENFSDSEGAEDSQSEDWRKEQMEAIASADMVIGADETEADSHASEPSESLPVSTSVDNAVSEEDLVRKNEKKPRASFGLMCLSMVLLFLIAFVSSSVTRSPSLDEFALKDVSLSDLSNFYLQSRAAAESAAAFAKVNYDRLARHVNQLSVDSVSFVAKVANECGKGEKRRPLQFMNLSDLRRNDWNDGHFLNNEAGNELDEDLNAEMDIPEEEEYGDIDSDEKCEEVFDTQDGVLVTETNTYREEAYAETDSNENSVQAYDTQDDVLVTEDMSPASTKLAELESEYSQDIQSQRVDEQNSVDQSAAVPMDQENEVEARVEAAASDGAETVRCHGDSNSASSSACTDTVLSDYKSRSAVTTLSEAVQSSSEDNSFVRDAIGVSSLFAALSAVAAFVYRYKRKPNSANVVQADTLLNKETDYAFTDSKHVIHQDKELSQNWQTQAESSCPSEMSSSFQKSASYSKKGVANEVQSSDRRKYSKRESLASSSEFSTGSPSYGSFTTYERIPIKNANGEEEIITPVRRSSRISNRHQITSP